MGIYCGTFTFVKDKETAKEFCKRKDKEATYYIRKHHPSHYTPYTGADADIANVHFVCWYWEKR